MKKVILHCFKFKFFLAKGWRWCHSRSECGCSDWTNKKVKVFASPWSSRTKSSDFKSAISAILFSLSVLFLFNQLFGNQPKDIVFISSKGLRQRSLWGKWATCSASFDEEIWREITSNCDFIKTEIEICVIWRKPDFSFKEQFRICKRASLVL